MAYRRIFSYSRISAWQDCPYRAQLKYQRNLERIVERTPVNLGSAFHAGMAAHFRGGSFLVGLTDWGKAIEPLWVSITDTLMARGVYAQAQQEIEANPNTTEWDLSQMQSLAISEIVLQAQELCRRTLEFMGDRYEVVSDEQGPIVERQITIPVTKSIGFTGIIDLLVHDRAKGANFILDFKTRADLKTDEAFDFDQQMALYQVLANVGLTVPVVGTIILQVRTRAMKPPQLNKDQKSMSRNKSIICDWPTYRRALLAANLDPMDYMDMKEVLEDRPFFLENQVFRGQDWIDGIWEATRETIKRLDRETGRVGRQWSRNNVVAERVFGWHCPRCFFREWCSAELRKQPTDIFVGHLYQIVSEPQDEAEEAKEE